MTFFMVIIAFWALVAVAIGAARKHASKRLKGLREIARLLGAPEPEYATMEVAGRRREQAVTYRLTYREEGSRQQPWTEIDVVVPPGQLSIALREQTAAEMRLRERGLVVDVETGDERFDDAFIVEAAPADVARELLDAKLRQTLLDARPFAVVPGERLLRVETPGHVLDGDRSPALLDVAAGLAAGFRPAHGAADLALEAAVPLAGSPFRASPDAEAVRAGKLARLDEIANLEEVKARRETFQRRMVLAFAGVIAVVVAVLLSQI